MGAPSRGATVTVNLTLQFSHTKRQSAMLDNPHLSKWGKEDQLDSGATAREEATKQDHRIHRAVGHGAKVSRTKNKMQSSRKVEVGDRVVATQDINLEPHTTVLRGECGTVARIDEEGNIDIELDEIHHGLAQFRNCIWVETHSGTDDVRAALLLVKNKDAKERACKILLQSCLPSRALHSTASASLLSLLSLTAA
jgi:hypothetical protein